ncbi:hypothetical protein GTQ99_02420 [Kineococcus sp. T13]|uniref:hypothetical protein n=1 Tax=Kineococcus vitellinus TaxID=2696565 RepID=UPI0014133BF6|nr:hypothetical protein [Kineococcus vitellinus]NAZ74283.1 hypothetical protein [Kineococcus vitellinus]
MITSPVTAHRTSPRSALRPVLRVLLPTRSPDRDRQQDRQQDRQVKPVRRLRPVLRGLGGLGGVLLLSGAALSAAPSAAHAQSFTTEQVKVAHVVRDAGRAVHASDRAVLAALETVIVESNVRANPQPCEGDHDSAGAFQQRRVWVPAGQRPSAGGWCVPGKDPRLNVKWAAQHFYTGSPGVQGAIALDKRGIDPWGQKIRTAGDLAQATQRSAFPDRYDEREGDARALLKLLGQGGPVNPYSPEEVCGAGFQVIDSADVGGRGTVYLLWNAGARQNCVVTLKARDLGKVTSTSAYLQVRGQTVATNSGSFKYYAGPVSKVAPGCIKWGGSIDGIKAGASAWEHCGS